MSTARIEVVKLDECSSGDLLRVRWGEMTYLGIIGPKNLASNIFGLVLFGSGEPVIVDAMPKRDLTIGRFNDNYVIAPTTFDYSIEGDDSFAAIGSFLVYKNLYNNALLMPILMVKNEENGKARPISIHGKTFSRFLSHVVQISFLDWAIVQGDIELYRHVARYGGQPR